MLVDLSLMRWFKDEFEDCSTASEFVFAQLSRVVCEPNDSNALVAAKTRKLEPSVAKS